MNGGKEEEDTLGFRATAREGQKSSLSHFQRCAAVRLSLQTSLPGTAACPLWTGVHDAWPCLSANDGQQIRRAAQTWPEQMRKARETRGG